MVLPGRKELGGVFLIDNLTVDRSFLKLSRVLRAQNQEFGVICLALRGFRNVVPFCARRPTGQDGQDLALSVISNCDRIGGELH